MLLQIFDVAADRWLGKVNGLTGFTETCQFNDFAENLKLPEIHNRFRDGRLKISF